MLRFEWLSNFNTTFFTHFVFAAGNANSIVHGHLAPSFIHMVSVLPSSILDAGFPFCSLGAVISQSAAIFSSAPAASPSASAVTGTAVNIIRHAVRIPTARFHSSCLIVTPLLPSIFVPKTLGNTSFNTNFSIADGSQIFNRLVFLTKAFPPASPLRHRASVSSASVQAALKSRASPPGTRQAGV